MAPHERVILTFLNWRIVIGPHDLQHFPLSQCFSLSEWLCHRAHDRTPIKTVEDHIGTEMTCQLGTTQQGPGDCLYVEIEVFSKLMPKDGVPQRLSGALREKAKVFRSALISLKVGVLDESHDVSGGTQCQEDGHKSS
jgi:hypothetical protein